MIRCTKKVTNINGSILEVLSDLANVISSIRKFMYKRMPEDIANKCIMTVIKMAFYEEDKSKAAEYEEELYAQLEEGYERRNEVKHGWRFN